MAKGINPKVHRKQKRQTVRLAAGNTFKAVYLLWPPQAGTRSPPLHRRAPNTGHPRGRSPPA